MQHTLTPSRSALLSQTLGAFLLFVSVCAVGGGAFLIMDPSGASIGLNVEMLAGSTFQNFWLPGLVLLVVNGMLSGICSAWALLGWRRAAEAGVGFGLFLMIWIGVQVAVMGLTSPLQIAFFLIGGMELSLGLALYRRRSAGHLPQVS